jgi:hypothetical protein
VNARQVHAIAAVGLGLVGMWGIGAVVVLALL